MSETPKQDSKRQLGIWALAISILALVVTALIGYFTIKYAYQSTETAKRQLRAYAYAAPGGVLNVEVGNPIQGYVWLENSGQTVARSVQVKMGMLVAPYPLPDLKKLLATMTLEKGLIVIHPRARHYVHRVGNAIDDEAKRKLFRAKKMAIYLIGVVRYRDIEGEPRESKFCHYYFGNRARHPVTKIDSIYRPEEVRYCDQHNTGN